MPYMKGKDSLNKGARMGDRGYQRNYQFRVDFGLIQIKGFVFTVDEAVESCKNALESLAKALDMSEAALLQIVKWKIKKVEAQVDPRDDN
jgi:hypothetical protein